MVLTLPFNNAESFDALPKATLIINGKLPKGLDS